MSLIVQKFGRTAVADPERIRAVAEHVASVHTQGHHVVVVVSAMGNRADELLQLASQLSPAPHARELDVLQTAAERISMSLLSMAIWGQGVRATSFTGSQAGIVTDTVHGNAEILEVRADRVRRALADGHVVVVGGSQGVSLGRDVTTLGQGGSDMTAVALAAALGSDVCEIFTDVGGVYTGDVGSYEEMLGTVSAGGAVVAPRAVEFAREHGVVLHVRSSLASEPGPPVTQSVSRQEVIHELLPSL